MPKQIEVKNDPENIIPIEIFEQAIVDIGQAMKRITDSRIKKSTMITLIQHDTKLGRAAIENVLDCMEMFESNFLKVKSVKK